MRDWNPEANNIFLKALDFRSPDERRAFLDEACAANAALRGKVDALLAAGEQAGSFLDAPASGLLGTLDQPLAPEQPGTVIGPYKLLQQIGAGGMGVVYMAEQDKPVRRMVALKIIRAGMDSRAVLARFEAERQALALMDHPNIARVLDAGTTESGRPYFVMELVKGVPITTFCDEHHLTLRERLELFVPVCQAIQHAHQKGLIHRDIKPSNVLVALYDDRPVPKVIDFGVAKATTQKLTDKTLFTAFGSVVGTFEYMSPEQAKLNQLDIDTRSDVYALGVLLYELLTGTTPLDRARLKTAVLDEVLRLIREEEPERPSTRLSTTQTRPAIAAARRAEPGQLGKVLRGELDWIVMKALEKDRTRRYETATGLARDVERYLKDEPVEACPPSAGYRLRKFARRYKTLLITAGAFLALLAAGTAVSAWQAVRALQAEREAREQSEAARAAQAAAEDHQRLAQQKEAAAVRETEKARTLVGMMQELLGTADPDAAKGGDYTVRQMVDDFEAGLGDRLKDQPDVEADLRMTIGQAYRFMRLDAKAEQQLRRVLELRRRTFGPDHRTVAQALTQLAWNLRLQLKLSDAETQARAALAILGQLGDRGEDRAEALRILAQTSYAQGKNPVETEAMYREALDLAERRAGGRPTALVANIAHDLASQLLVQGRAAEGLALATRSVALHRIVHSDKHPETAHGLRVMGWCHEALGQLDEAERALRESLTVFRRAHGSRTHPFAVATLGALLANLDAQYKDEAAEAVLKECLTAWQKPDLSSVEVADVVHSERGNACLNRGEYAAAERHYRAALEAARKTAMPLLDPKVQSFQFAVGATQYIQGKTEEARAAVQGLVLPARLATLKADLPPGLQIAFAFALAVGGSGKPEELQAAQTLARRAVEQLEGGIPAGRGLGAWALTLALHRGGDRDRAIDELRRALTLAKPFARSGEVLGLFSWRELEALLVKCLIEKGDRSAAEEALRDGLKTLQANLPAGHPELAAAQVRLATVLADQQRYADAEPLLLAAYATLKAHPQAAASAFLKGRRADAAERLARLYDAWGKPDEAAKWRKELEAVKARKQGPVRP